MKNLLLSIFTLLLLAGCSSISEDIADNAFPGMTKQELLEEVGVPSSTKGSMYYDRPGDVWYYWTNNPPVTVYFDSNGRVATWVTGAIGYTENLKELQEQKKQLGNADLESAAKEDTKSAETKNSAAADKPVAVEENSANGEGAKIAKEVSVESKGQDVNASAAKAAPEVKVSAEAKTDPEAKSASPASAGESAPAKSAEPPAPSVKTSEDSAPAAVPESRQTSKKVTNLI